MADLNKFRFSIDRGGTFTDIYAEVPGESGFRVVKLLSEDPQNYDDAPREGIRRILAETTGIDIPKNSVPAEMIEWIRMGTTVATNALIQRSGARTALLTTAGHRDALEMAHEDRFEQYDVMIDRPRPLVPRYLRLPVRERMDRNGRILVPLDDATVEAALEALEGRGLRVQVEPVGGGRAGCLRA